MSPYSLSSARMQALAFGIAGIALFSGMDALLKHLTASTPSLVVTFGRYFCALPFALLIWWRAGRPSVTGEMLRAHGLRAAVISTSGALFIWGLSVLPLAEAITLSFVAPLIVPFVAAVMLKEKVRPQNIVASLLGFVGAMIAVMGGQEAAATAGHDPKLHQLGVLAIVVFALGYAVQASLLRRRAQRDGSAIVGVLGTALPALLVAGPATAFGQMPALATVPEFVAMGALAAVSLWCLSEAYARAEAQMLAPLEFTGLGWAALFGYVFFAEVPGVAMWIGAGVIVVACAWNGWASAQADAGVPEAP